jgi:ABC-type polysaccharide/polyol phosphate export permease
MTWLLFSAVANSGKPTTIAAKFTKSMNTKWGHLFLADLTWEAAKVILGGVITLVFYAIFPFPMLGVPISHPDLLLLFLAWAITMTLGAGFGIVLQAALRRWPTLAFTMETIRWLLFITSGIYSPYYNWPWWIARIVWFQPMTAAIEYTRHALDAGYPVDDLSLAYSAAVGFALLFLALGFRRWELRTSAR